MSNMNGKDKKNEKNRAAQPYVIDHIAETIVFTQAFLKAAGNVGNSEYKVFMQLKRDFPDYSYEKRACKKCEDRVSLKGLNKDFMMKFIKVRYGEKSDEYKKFTAQSAYSESFRSPTMYMRKWFTETYPEWHEYKVNVELQLPDDNERAENNEEPV